MDDRTYVAQALFERMRESDVEFCVLGDTRRYPDEIPSDLDIAVAPQELARMPRLLSQFSQDLGLRLVQLIRHERSACYFVLAWHDDFGRPRFLMPDLCSDYRRGGRLLLSAETLLGGRRAAADEFGRAKGFWVPPPDVQFIYYLLKKIDKQKLDAAHGEYLTEQWREDPDGALRRMVPFWPELRDNGLIAGAAERGDWSGVQAVLPRLRRSLRRAAPLSAGAMLREALRIAGRILRPTGMTVAFLGPDGCGKSSVIERVAADLAPAFRRVESFHLRPRVLGREKSADTTQAIRPYLRPPRGAAASLAKLGWFVADYAVGFAARLRPLRTRSGLALFDRYLHDLLADPARYRYGAPMAFARLAARLVPGPDLWVLLDAPARVIQARKREVSPEQSEWQRRAYLALGAKLDDAVLIDASGSLPAVTAHVEQAILGWLERRIEGRHARARTVEKNPLAARVLLFFCRRRVPVLSHLVRIAFHSDIYCRIRAPIHMPHPYGIVIHSKSVIGSRVTVMQQVTIGGKDLGRDEAPVIEDDVYIGAGARVLGAVRVGRGAIIGANAVITRDVPSYCTVVGANRVLHRAAAAENDDASGHPAVAAHGS
jgi:serine acetyltransferase/thymidylate kinase